MHLHHLLFYINLMSLLPHCNLEAPVLLEDFWLQPKPILPHCSLRDTHRREFSNLCAQTIFYWFGLHKHKETSLKFCHQKKKKIIKKRGQLKSSEALKDSCNPDS